MLLKDNEEKKQFIEKLEKELDAVRKYNKVLVPKLKTAEKNLASLTKENEQLKEDQKNVAIATKELREKLLTTSNNLTRVEVESMTFKLARDKLSQEAEKLRSIEKEQKLQIARLQKESQDNLN